MTSGPRRGGCAVPDRPRDARRRRRPPRRAAGRSPAADSAAPRTSWSTRGESLDRSRALVPTRAMCDSRGGRWRGQAWRRAAISRRSRVAAVRSTRVGSPSASTCSPGHPDVAHQPGAARPDQVRQELGVVGGVDEGGVGEVDVHQVRPAARFQGAEVVAADRGRTVPRGHQQQLPRRERGRVAAGHPGEEAGEPGLGPQVEVVPGRRAVRPQPHPHPRPPQRRHPGDARRELRVRARAVRHGRPARGQQPDVVVARAAPRARRAPGRRRTRRARPAAPAPSRARRAARRPPPSSRPGAGAAARPAPGRAPRPTGAPRAAACTPRAARSPARPARPARSAGRRGRCAREMPLRIASQLPSRSQPGAAMTPGVSSTREPTASTASTTASVKKYISTLVVVPVRSSSTQPDVMPARTSDAVSRPSAGHITSCSQRSSGRSPPIPRSSSIGVWQWVLTSPGSSTPASSRTGPADAAAPPRAARPR